MVILHRQKMSMPTQKGGVGKRDQIKQLSMGGVWMEGTHFNCTNFSYSLPHCIFDLGWSIHVLIYGLTLLDALWPFITTPALQCIFLLLLM